MRLNYTFGNILFTILCLGIFSFSANGQSVEDLEIKHGFQDIKLDSEISDYSNLIFKKSIKIKKSEEPILLYEPEKGSYQRIGDVSIKDFEVRAFLGKIIEIKIITPKDSDIMKALKLLYGEPNFSVRSNAWEWRSDGVTLSVKSIARNKIEIIYASRKLNQYIKDKKEEDVENISTDFYP